MNQGSRRIININVHRPVIGSILHEQNLSLNLIYIYSRCFCLFSTSSKIFLKWKVRLFSLGVLSLKEKSISYKLGVWSFKGSDNEMPPSCILGNVKSCFCFFCCNTTFACVASKCCHWRSINNESSFERWISGGLYEDTRMDDRVWRCIRGLLNLITTYLLNLLCMFSSFFSFRAICFVHLKPQYIVLTTVI